MNKSIILFLAVILAVIGAAMNTACLKKGSSLTEEQIKRYIAAYSKIRVLGPELAAKAGTIGPGQAGYEKIEQAVKAAGFRDFGEFMQTQVAVGAAMSLVETDLYKEKMNTLADDLGNTDRLAKEFSGLLDNPDIPEERKAEVRARIKQAGANSLKAKEDMNAQFRKSEGMLNRMRSLTDDGSVALVKKYHKELRECMTGMRPE